MSTETLQRETVPSALLSAVGSLSVVEPPPVSPAQEPRHRLQEAHVNAALSIPHPAHLSEGRSGNCGRAWPSHRVSSKTRSRSTGSEPRAPGAQTALLDPNATGVSHAQPRHLEMMTWPWQVSLFPSLNTQKNSRQLGTKGPKACGTASMSLNKPGPTDGEGLVQGRDFVQGTSEPPWMQLFLMRVTALPG